MTEPLKAYEVREGGEGYCAVVFATNGATARREGASELGTDWEGIETCRRAPDLDQYAPGPVPAMTLLDHGWWFECGHCGQRVSHDMDEDDEREFLGDPADYQPRPAGNGGVFCSASCECADHMDKRGQDEAEAALIEVFEAKFPGATLVSLHVYRGPRLVPKTDYAKRVRSIEYAVYFTLPGFENTATWEFGSSKVSVDARDLDAFHAWKGSV